MMDPINRLYREWSDAKNRRLKTRARDRLLRAIWETYHPRLQVYLGRSFSCPPQDREDRASEILLRAFESLEKYDGRYAFSTWLYTLARNSQIDLLRKKTLPLADEPPSEWSAPGEERPDQILFREIDRKAINQAVDRLKPGERELIFLAFYEELTYKEISRITGKPVGTVKYAMYRIRGALKATLREELAL